ncbi:MAG: hypothetical protein V4594_01870 [Bacteroidota bacterium]
MRLTFILLFGLFSLTCFAQTKPEAIAKINSLLKKTEGKVYKVPYQETSIVMKIKKQVLSESGYDELIDMDDHLIKTKTSKLDFAKCYEWRYAIDDSDKISGVILDFEDEMDQVKTFSNGDTTEKPEAYLSFYVLKADVPALLKLVNILAGKIIPEEKVGL